MQSGKESASIRQSGMYRSILNGCPTNDSLSPMVLRIIHRAPSMVRNVSIDPRPYLNMFEVIFWKLSFQKDISTFPEYFQVATSVEHTKSALKGPKSRIIPFFQIVEYFIPVNQTENLTALLHILESTKPTDNREICCPRPSRCLAAGKLWRPPFLSRLPK